MAVVFGPGFSTGSFMQLFVNDANEILILDNGDVMSACCCGGGISCDYPTINATVTGASGTINWLGKVWNLPGDSGVTHEICPTGYDLTGSTEYFENWAFADGSVYTVTNLFRMLRQWNPYNNNNQINRIILRTSGMTPSSFLRDQQRRYTSYFFSTNTYTTYKSDIGVFSTPADFPTTNDYRIITDTTNNSCFFGSYTNGSGITYEWEPANWY